MITTTTFCRLYKVYHGIERLSTALLKLDKSLLLWKHRLNVTEQAVHACVHPPYHDPPGVSAYCRLPSPSVAERCIEWCRCECVSVWVWIGRYSCTLTLIVTIVLTYLNYPILSYPVVLLIGHVGTLITTLLTFLSSPFHVPIMTMIIRLRQC